MVIKSAGGITFTVEGDPAPQGSKRHVGNGRMIESSKKVKPWREAVALAARKAYGKDLPVGCAVGLDVVFTFPRPASVSAKKRPHHSVRPDLSKLLRSTEDAMTGIIYKDDAQIVQVMMNKEYSANKSSGARIIVHYYRTETSA